ncbi:acetylcholinesterase-like [Lytechinus pictus]|uniref:acetylcholinesterase-like n=1 Tax=Lytechinus pictus TaxID=7653 RepID=UPI0030BA013F
MEFRIIFSLLCLVLMTDISTADPTVTVAQGILVGKTVNFTEEDYIGVDKSFDVYLGVPFADPPRRFKPPVAKQPWDGPLTVKEFKDACSQTSPPPSYAGPLSEDCLYLNVYSPSPKDAEAPGNLGMLDQVAALQWIYDNVEAFGGDKDRITISGESAGAASVHYLTLSKRSRHLFNQAIIQSGTTSFDSRPAEIEVQDARNLGEALDCSTSPSSALVACLETKTPDEILNASLPAYSSCPISVDGNFLEDKPINLYEQNDFKRCPVLTGVSKDDGTLFLRFLFASSLHLPRPTLNSTGLEELIRGLMAPYGVTDDILIAAILQQYTDWSIVENPSADLMPSFIEFAGDHRFACPSDQFVRYHAGVGDTVFKYFLTHEPSRSRLGLPDWFGAGHAEEITFVFGLPFIEHLPLRGLDQMTDEEKKLSVKMMKLWTNFAKFGDPTSGADPSEGLGTWPSFTVPELSYKEISLDLGVGRALKANQCNFWNDYFPKLQDDIASMDQGLLDWRSEFTRWQGEMSDWQREYDQYKKTPRCN